MHLSRKRCKEALGDGYHKRADNRPTIGRDAGQSPSPRGTRNALKRDYLWSLGARNSSHLPFPRTPFTCLDSTTHSSCYFWLLAIWASVASSQSAYRLENIGMAAAFVILRFATRRNTEAGNLCAIVDRQAPALRVTPSGPISSQIDFSHLPVPGFMTNCGQ
jgi:hypothetical protein